MAEHSGKTIKVTLVRSLIGTMRTHRATVRGLGLRRINHAVQVIDTPATRGMIAKVAYLLKCEG
jgi:large subunit ribosomal protein L30